MAVTLEWVRDNYDNNPKNRLIDFDEAIQSTRDFLNNIIDKEQLDAIQDAHNKQTLLPAYDTPTPICAPGDKRCRDANTVEQCRADGSGWNVVQVCATGFKCENGSCVPVTTTVTLEWVRDNYDANKNRLIDFDEAIKSTQDYANNRINKEQLDAVQDAYNRKTLLPAYDTPTPPPNMETRTVLLTEGSHTIQVSFTGYDTLNATINVSSTGVTCTVGPCNTQGPPGVTTSGWTVTTYLKSATTTTGYAAWLSGKGGLTNVTLSDIFELKDAFIGLTNIGFTPTLPQIMECKDAFIGL